VVKSLEASLWAFHDADTFEEAVLRAVNLGDDADTTGAICGQLAGAYWGESGIPESLQGGSGTHGYTREGAGGDCRRIDEVKRNTSGVADLPFCAERLRPARSSLLKQVQFDGRGPLHLPCFWPRSTRSSSNVSRKSCNTSPTELFNLWAVSCPLMSRSRSYSLAFARWGTPQEEVDGRFLPGERACSL